ncbi:DGQHR domain-containing protein, partial [Fictibacillus barbaricus]
MSSLNKNIIIENVIQTKMRGKVIYQSNISSHDSTKLLFVKPFDDPSGKGYQRPVNKKRCQDFSEYLSIGDGALFTPILLNAMGNWEFSAYDSKRPSFGRLFCKGKASVMDGQHRLGGIEIYTKESNISLNIPFLAFHWLDEDEEIMLFDTINTKAKGIGSSLSRYLKRDNEELSWVATQLIIQKDSPFHEKGTIIGQRSKGRHITLQNIYTALSMLTKDSIVTELNKEKILLIATTYFNIIKKMFPNEWGDYKNYKMTHIIGINALSLVGNQVIRKHFDKDSNNIDINQMTKTLYKIKNVDWSAEGSMKYLKGITGSRTLAKEL